MKKRKIWLKIVLFIVILVGSVLGISRLFCVDDYRIKETYKNFYSERKNSLDAVYVGASNVYAYWQPPIAWKNYGIAVDQFSVPNMPVSAAQYMIDEARKTQPDALYIINLNMFKNLDVKNSEIHYVVDYMPFSINKLKIINKLSDELDCSLLKRIEFLFPMIRFHSAWSELTEKDFVSDDIKIKGASHYGSFLTQATDFTGQFYEVKSSASLSEKQLEMLNELLNYCEESDANVLFVAVPQMKNDKNMAEINEMSRIVSERGYDVLNLENSIDEIGLTPTWDFYNEKHTNIHGSIKFTNYLSQYLVEQYGFTDKRGQADYADWDAQTATYYDLISRNTIDLEREMTQFDNKLIAPVVSQKSCGQTILLSWSASKNAQEYYIYRKQSNTSWEWIGKTDENTLSFADKNLKINQNYQYTVVPVRYEGSELIYGCFNITGITATTTINAPKLLSLEQTKKGVTITWKPIKKAEGYCVYRKINGQNWIELAVLDANQSSYTDSSFEKDIPYRYTVRAICAETQGYYEKSGVLLLHDIEAPEVTSSLKEGICTLEWEPVIGADSYRVYRDDEIISNQQTDAFFVDNTAEENQQYRYKVAALISDGEKCYEYKSKDILILNSDEEGGAQ